ncbi:MAG TPA: glutamyl-tRNA reductase [Candidatus Polarisedimenticolia bacterium]|nr:glutamyl-tRNA reductase [Candidatus Polarisedimenticolia bacterium]
MPILLFGANHRSAPLELRERLVVPEADLGEVVRRLIAAAGLEEALILSTCNRTEILAHREMPGGGEAIRDFVHRQTGVEIDLLDRHCYLHADRAAVRHLFRVAASLDSMVVGEPQILGQVKEAYAVAQAAGGLRGRLDALMQRAFSVAKRVRERTGIARSPVSIAHAAAARAREIFGDLGRTHVLILGAGKMARLAAQHVTAGGVGSITVVNRAYQRGALLAEELGGQAFGWDQLGTSLERADVVIVSTGAPHHVVTTGDAQRLARQRRGRPIFFIDIAMPRNVDPAVNTLDNVYVYDLDDLKGVAEAGLRERQREATEAEAMVEREAAVYSDGLDAPDVAPTIVALRERLLAVGAAEFDRHRARLGPLTPEQERVLDELRTALMNKVLHPPMQALKSAAAEPGGERLIAILRAAFGLEDHGPGRGRT